MTENHDGQKIKRKRKLFAGGGLLLLTTVSLFSVGFGAWVIYGTGQSTNSFDIEVANVIDYSRYFLFNEDESTIGNNRTKTSYLTYIDEGIVENDEVVYLGTFSFYLACRIRGDNGEGLYTTNALLSSFTLNLRLVDNGSFYISQYFDNSVNSKVNYSINNSGTNTTASSSKNDRTISLSATCSDQTQLSQSYLFYRFDVIFDFSSYQNFDSQELSGTSLRIGVVSYSSQ